ncbi:MAG: hypothetical protein MZV64_63835 [Ignavibacteriales bacterium]|nr:hypothetical protein [Ignavibacteriales bacterium]
MLGDVALDEDGAFGRVESRGHVVESGVPDPLGQPRRLVVDRDGVKVDDGEEAVVIVRQPDPVLDGPEVVADVDGAARLDAAQDAFARVHGRSSFGYRGYSITTGPGIRPAPWPSPPRSCAPRTRRTGPRRPGRRSARPPSGPRRGRPGGRRGPR